MQDAPAGSQVQDGRMSDLKMNQSISEDSHDVALQLLGGETLQHLLLGQPLLYVLPTVLGLVLRSSQSRTVLLVRLATLHMGFLGIRSPEGLPVAAALEVATVGHRHEDAVAGLIFTYSFWMIGWFGLYPSVFRR